MNWLVPLPVALPLLLAAALVAAAPICRRRIADSVAIGAASLVTLACLWLLRQSSHGTIVYWFGQWVPRGRAAIGISFAIDPIGAALAGFCAFLVAVALIYSWEYFEAVRTYFHALMLIFLAAMTGFCLTGDLFNLFVFFELMSVVAYALTGYKVEEKQALAGAMNFAVTNSIGGFLVLMGIALLYGRTGALNLAQVGETLARHPVDGLTMVSLTLLWGGFFVKAAAVPFHFWLADAHAVAPTPVCVLFSGVMIELGLYGAFRVYWTVFHPLLVPEENGIRMVLMGLGTVTVLVGAIMCFAQRHVKRLLAFSSVSHLGMMLLGLACLTARGIAGTALYLLGHGCVKGGLFLCSGILLHRLGRVDQVELFGKARKLIVLGITFAIGGLGLAGCPPFGTCLGKQTLEEAGSAVGQGWYRWILLFGSVLTGAAVLRVTAMVFLGWGALSSKEARSPTARQQEPETTKAHRRIPLVMLGSAAILVLAPLATAFSGNALSRTVEAAADRFADQPAYEQAVMAGSPTGPIRSRPMAPAGAAETLLGIAAGGLAVVLALLSLFANRFPARCRRFLQSVGHPFLSALRRIHTGHLGDLIVWLVIGLVVIGAGLILAVGNRFGLEVP